MRNLYQLVMDTDVNPLKDLPRSEPGFTQGNEPRLQLAVGKIGEQGFS